MDSIVWRDDRLCVCTGIESKFICNSCSLVSEILVGKAANIGTIWLRGINISSIFPFLYLWTDLHLLPSCFRWPVNNQETFSDNIVTHLTSLWSMMTSSQVFKLSVSMLLRITPNRLRVLFTMLYIVFRLCFLVFVGRYMCRFSEFTKSDQKFAHHAFPYTPCISP